MIYRKIEELCSPMVKNITLKELSDDDTLSPVYGASGLVGYIDKYYADIEYIGIIKDGAGVGRTNIYPSHSSLLGTMQYIFPNNQVNCRYLMYAIRYLKLGDTLSGSAIPHIYYKNYKNAKIRFIDLKQQAKIADNLCNIENAIDICKAKISALDELVKSRFIEMFGDPISNSYNWDKVHLSDLAEIKIGPFGSLLHKDDYISNGHPLINPTHIVDGKICIDNNFTISDQKFEELKPYHLKIGDIVLGRRGEMGRCAVVEVDGMICGTGSLFIRPKNGVIADYIQKIISFPSFKKMIEDKAVGQTMLNLNVPIVSNFEIIKPPINIQQEYYKLINQIDKSKFIVRQQIKDLQELLDSKMDEYFG